MLCIAHGIATRLEKGVGRAAFCLLLASCAHAPAELSPRAALGKLFVADASFAVHGATAIIDSYLTDLNQFGSARAEEPGEYDIVTNAPPYAR